MPLGAGKEYAGTGKSLEDFARVGAIEKLFFLFVSTVLNKNFRLEIKI